MTWLRLDTDFPDHEIIGQFAEALKVDGDRAAMSLIRVWTRFGDYAPDGILNGVTDTTLEDWARWRGKKGAFAKMFRKLGIGSDGKVKGWWRQEALLRHQMGKKKPAGKPPDSRESGAILSPDLRPNAAGKSPESRRISACYVDGDVNERTPPPTADAISTRLRERLAGQPGENAVLGFLAALPLKERTDSWAGILGNMLEGLGLPEGKPCTVEELAIACTDYVAAAPDRWGGAHFRSFVVRAMKGGRKTPEAGRTPSQRALEKARREEASHA